ncbi:hypothetical protein BS50DRAFT_368049 [Corynespora cassiicola Philippines]|uniref:Uncharacterized protein n=1 Tax=Corynespora cassiicola Philippines TaxID=1448308 RepID=A0A2T2N145_CORCC|nr:hypothetical protein BS50DRAFT_368049 [Corynespora cassiicola Philippines]
MAAMSSYKSVFSYNITRPYPFQWFTPVVVILGILAAVLFSFMNLATSGYDMVTAATSNPNMTITNVTYFQNWPSFFTSKIRPKCEPQALAANREYYTNNTALSYRLESLSYDNAMGLSKYPDTPYLNNPLRDCKIFQIEYYYEQDERLAQGWTVSVRAYISCAVDTEVGRMWLKMSTTYGSGSEVTSSHLNPDEESKASLWWGGSLLFWYQEKVKHDINHAAARFMNSSGDFPMKKGTVIFFPLLRITDSDQYKSNTSWLEDKPLCTIFPNPESAEIVHLWDCDSNERYPYNLFHDIGLDAGMLAKAFYSTVMADLGQASVNVLDNRDLLEYFTESFSYFSTFIKTVNIGNLAKGPYASANASRWNLVISPSVLSTTYLCQVPQLKSTGSLIFSVLIANLVLLQALWKFFNFFASFFMLRKYPEANSCLGCQNIKKSTESGVELGEYSPLVQEGNLK